MAITKELIEDKIEVVGDYKTIQVLEQLQSSKKMA